ncbi:hypothetical protein E3N88_16185 [Mikania micrantha]|uniref:hexokinase n=1 Tax=Mikania micrantha TaxID=192012 RepID=A0A5N6P0T4_9ASTR|nr:hypothetical protein E3N88_16185 [Mikania micrantha]
MDPNQNPNYYNPNTPPNRNTNTPPPNWVFTPSPMNPFFDSNCYRPNFDSSPQGFYTFADYGSSPQPHGFTQLSQDEVVPETQAVTNAGPSTQPKQKRRHRRKQAADTEPAVGGSSRIEKWTTEEEFQLTKAWIDVSEDPIVGRNQKGPDFWSKIRNQFFQAMGRGEYRTNDMLSSKWRDMNLKVRKFNGIYSQKWQTRRSGQSDAMIEREAEEQYREEFNVPFSLQRRLGVAVGFAVASCAIAAVMVGRRVKSRRRWWRVVRAVDEFEEAAATPVGRLRQVVDAMAVEMHAGLASEGGSKLKMLLTYVDNLPDGSENGIYYALHVGGTNFRILRIQLGGQRSIIEHDVERKPIPQLLMTSTSEEFFDFIASSLKEFVETKGNGLQLAEVRRKDLGFTFSFPVKQTSVSSGTLIKWTKGFAIEDMVEKDVVECLEKALSRRGLDMNVAALVNDSVGTLAVGHFIDNDTVAAVVIGTGTNACYLERADAVIKCQGLLTTSGGVVINMEWGNFWSSHLPRTSYDIELDSESQNPNDQGFEKMISGLYLGDIVRRVICRLCIESDIFGSLSSKLSTRFVLRRAARLAAAGIVGILKKIGRDGTGGIAGGRIKGYKSGKMRRSVVAVEGGLYTSYTIFREYLNNAVAEILGEEIAPYVILKMMEDGSGIGTAMLAASNSARSVDTVQVL